jgi:heme-degrading monooxygenase HmoA
MSEYAYVWEFEVVPTRQKEFEHQYGSDGAWVALFRLHSGYVGSRLLQDRADPLRYVTIDRWQNEASFLSFRKQFAAQYDALDEACEQLTAAERSLGTLISK